MTQPTITQKNNQNFSSTSFFFGAGAILLLVAIILTIGQAFRQIKVGFGECQLKADTALTDQQKARGLAGRSTIPDNYAMLFPYHNDQPTFWMKDMLTSIDIVWVENNQVVQINPKVPVDDGAVTYEPSQPIDWVIEVAAGRTEACHVLPGTKINGLHS